MNWRVARSQAKGHLEPWTPASLALSRRVARKSAQQKSDQCPTRAHPNKIKENQRENTHARTHVHTRKCTHAHSTRSRTTGDTAIRFPMVAKIGDPHLEHLLRSQQQRSHAVSLACALAHALHYSLPRAPLIWTTVRASCSRSGSQRERFVGFLFTASATCFLQKAVCYSTGKGPDASIRREMGSDPFLPLTSRRTSFESPVG